MHYLFYFQLLILTFFYSFFTTHKFLNKNHINCCYLCRLFIGLAPRCYCHVLPGLWLALAQATLSQLAPLIKSNKSVQINQRDSQEQSVQINLCTALGAFVKELTLCKGLEEEIIKREERKNNS